MPKLRIALLLALLLSGWVLAAPRVYKATDGSFTVTADESFTEKKEPGFVLNLSSDQSQVRVLKKAVPPGRKIGDPKAFLTVPPDWKPQNSYLAEVGGEPAAFVVCTPPWYAAIGYQCLLASLERGDNFYQFHYVFPKGTAPTALPRAKAFMKSVKWTK